MKSITLALFISLFSTPFSPLSFSLSYTHFLTLHSHSLSPAYNSYHSDPIPTLARSFASRTPVFSRLSFLLPFALPFSFRSLIVFFFILETIQIPSIMLELQKPGQPAATSEAPGIAARYDSANTTTTRPLHESNS